MSAGNYLATATPLRLAVGGVGVGIPILAVEQVGDVALGGALVAVSLAPSILAAPLAGVALDRSAHPRRLIAAAGFGSAAAFAVAAFLGHVPLWLVFTALVVAGTVSPFTMGGLSSFVTDEIPHERRAFALDAMSYNIGAVIGPGTVAATAALGSARIAMLVVAASAAIGASAALTTHLRPRNASVGSPWRAMRDGLTWIARHRPLAVVTASGTLSQFGGGALAIAAVALTIERAGDPDGGAVIVSAFAVGALVGSLWISWRPDTRSPEFSMGAGFAATGALTIVALLDIGSWWTIGAIALSGVFTAASTAAMLRLRTLQSPRAVRAQVFTVGGGLRAAAAAAGAGVAGVAAVSVGAGWLLTGVGLCWIASGALLLAYPRGAATIED
ncbi:MFS transporter [Agromyces sp. SYSU T00194]|uniref:MFS transporter n=1 Tax=Agromyces chitinivorans TaxID=3158560 RepID=UPI003391CC42